MFDSKMNKNEPDGVDVPAAASWHRRGVWPCG